MSTVPASGRSFERIGGKDLERLAEIARRDREDLFRRNQRLRTLYADRVLAVALCQGAAAHFLTGKRGVQDFDVWTFFASHRDAPFP